MRFIILAACVAALGGCAGDCGGFQMGGGTLYMGAPSIGVQPNSAAVRVEGYDVRTETVYSKRNAPGNTVRYEGGYSAPSAGMDCK